MIKNLTLLIFGLTILLIHTLVAQKPKVYFAKFKNDADGAYSIIHDDFGGNWASGIADYADTIAYNRSIPLNIAIITGHCDETDWEKAKEMVKHGHQIVNHSKNHKCGKKEGECYPGSEHWNESNFKEEIDSSSAQILKYTGKHPAFFMFPFDIYTDTMITYLKHIGFVGARAGERDALIQKIEDPFYLNFKAFFPGQSQTDLNEFADDAISNNSWAIREVHGVNDESWGNITLNDYLGHLDHLKSLKEKNKLWITTLSDGLLYDYLRTKYFPVVKRDKSDKIIEIKFKATNGNGKIGSNGLKSLINSSNLKSITLVIDDYTEPISSIVQSDENIPFVKLNGKILVNVDPRKGKLSIQ